MRVILEFNNVGKRYNNWLFHNITFKLLEGEALIVTGPNGSGKTTLLAIAAGIINSTKGEVVLLEHNLARLSRGARAKLRRNISIIPQTPSLPPRLKVIQAIILAAVTADRNPEEAKRYGLQLLEQLGLKEKAKERISSLSGGEKRKVEIVTALVRKPKLLLADEPYNMLDPEAKARVTQLFIQYLQQGGTLIITTPNKPDIPLKAKHIIQLPQTQAQQQP